MSGTNQLGGVVPAPVKGGLVADLTLAGAMKAAAFYVEAFGAEIATAMSVDDQGRTMHVHFYRNGASPILSDAFPEHGHVLQPPQAFALMPMVDDLDARDAQAVAAGATAVMPRPTCSGAIATTICTTPAACSGR